MMASKGHGSVKNDTMDAMTVTPLASTRDAPFLIQGGDEATSGGALGNKLRFSRTVLGSDSEGRSVRADSNKSTSSQQYATGAWNVAFGGTCSITNVLVLACCPCVPAAKIHGMLGSSFESGVLYFGCLAFGLIITLGLSFSNTSTVDISARSAPSSSGYVRDDFVAAEADPSTVDPTATPIATTTTSSNAMLYGGLALAMLTLFLLGVAFLRTKARHRFNIPGNRTVDCTQSFACCWCVLSQTQAHLEKNNRYEFGLDTPPDTLPAFS